MTQKAMQVSRWMMVLSLVSAGLLSSVAQAKVNWRTDLEAAHAEALKANKPMLVQITASWCGPCHRMLKNTYGDADLARDVNQAFVPVLIDSDENPEIVKEIGVSAYPYFCVVSPTEGIIKSFKGYKDVQKYRKEMGSLLSPAPAVMVVKQETKAPTKAAAAPAVTKPALAFHGLDLVSAIEHETWLKGRADIRLVHAGSEYRFTTLANAQRFQSNTARYLPVNAGKCPVTGQQGHLQFAALFGSRLYLCASAQSHNQFLSKPEQFVSAVEQAPKTHVSNHPGSMDSNAPIEPAEMYQYGRPMSKDCDSCATNDETSFMHR